MLIDPRIVQVVLPLIPMLADPENYHHPSNVERLGVAWHLKIMQLGDVGLSPNISYEPRGLYCFYPD